MNENNKEVENTEHGRQASAADETLLGEVNRIKWNSAFYAGALSGYKAELKKAQDAGIDIRFNRVDQFEDLYNDYVTLENLYIAILHGFVDEKDTIDMIKKTVGK